MANSDKDILITPNTGTVNEPELSFVGYGNSAINLKVKDDSYGKVVFENGNKTYLEIKGGTDKKVTGVSEDGNIVFQADKEQITIGSGSDEDAVVLGEGLQLPVYRTNALPLAEEGSLAYDEDEDCAKFFNGQNWIPFGFANSGMTPYTAGVSAQQIKRDYPWSDNGYYWIKTDIGPQRLFCYMDQNILGGGWMMLNPAIAPVYAWNQTSAEWTDSQVGLKFNSDIATILKANVTLLEILLTLE